MAKKKQRRTTKSIKKRGKQNTIETIDIDDVYRLVNRVQVNKKSVRFSVELNAASCVENILKDLQIDYTRIDFKTKTRFSLTPNTSEETVVDIDIDFFDDEILNNEDF